MPATNDAYRELFERSADAILIIEGDRFVECNDAAVRMLRCRTHEEVLSTHPSELSPPTQPDGRNSFEKANEMMAIAFKKGSHRFEWAHQRADGDVFPVEVLLTAIQTEDRRVLHTVWRDITERRQLEEQTRRAQRLETVGILAGGVAHDFNNQLTVVIGSLGIALEDPATTSEIRDLLAVALEAADRCATLTRQLLAFSRRQPLHVTAISVDALLEDVTALVTRTLGDDIQVTVDVATDAGGLTVDPSEIKRAILNLAHNARDAMNGGGTLTLRARRAVIGSDEADALGLTPGPFVQLEVEDTGPGMEADVMERAFEPFFTTKTANQGRGMGLSVVYGIVRQCGGSIRLESAPGEGLTVRLLLPAADEEAPEGRP